MLRFATLRTVALPLARVALTPAAPARLFCVSSLRSFSQSASVAAEEKAPVVRRPRPPTALAMAKAEIKQVKAELRARAAKLAEEAKATKEKVKAAKLADKAAKAKAKAKLAANPPISPRAVKGQSPAACCCLPFFSDSRVMGFVRCTRTDV